jgi:hypothetical protein
LLAEELVVIDSDSHLWLSTSPLLDIVLRLDQNDETYSWNGWNKQQIKDFLDSLPSQLSLVVGDWETIPEKESSPGMTWINEQKGLCYEAVSFNRL